MRLELFAEAFQQLASISAILGGLAFTAAAALISVVVGSGHGKSMERAATITVGTAVVSSVLFIIAALMWSFMSADLNRAISREIAGVGNILNKNWIASLHLIGGCVLFFVSLGSSGWIASRRVGSVTTIAAGWGLLALVMMIYWFADVN